MQMTLDRRSVALRYDCDESMSEHMPGTLLATMMLFGTIFNVCVVMLIGMIL